MSAADSYPADIDIRPLAVRDAEAAAWLEVDGYYDGVGSAVTREQAHAHGFVDAAEVDELRAWAAR